MCALLFKAEWFLGTARPRTVVLSHLQQRVTSTRMGWEDHKPTLSLKTKGQQTAAAANIKLKADKRKVSKGRSLSLPPKHRNHISLFLLSSSGALQPSSLHFHCHPDPRKWHCLMTNMSIKIKIHICTVY